MTTRRIPWLDIVALCCALALLLVTLCGCSSTVTAPAGSAVSASIDAQARASTDHQAADLAAIEAARAEAARVNAEEVAQIAAAMAKATPTPELIERAASARVAAVEATATARTTAAVANAQRSTADRAQEAADNAAKGAEVERQEQATAARQESVRFWCAVVGGALALAGVLGAVLLGYLSRPRLAAIAGGAGVLLGILVPLYGASLPWIEAAAPWVLLALITGAALLAWWASRHIADLRAIVEAPTHDDLSDRVRAEAIKLGWPVPHPTEPA